MTASYHGPNAYALSSRLLALAIDCEETDGWEGAAPDLRDAADLLEQFAVTVRHIYATRMPDTWFVCGASTVTDSNGLPDRIHVCPAYGADFSVIYQRVDRGAYDTPVSRKANISQADADRVVRDVRASGTDARQRQDAEERLDPKGDGPTPKGGRP